MIPTLDGNETSASVAAMNTLVGGFDDKMSALFGGRSFILAGNQSFVSIPSTIFGRPFYFTSNVHPTAYCTRLPGYIARTGTANDPISGTPTSITYARPYDHTQFTSAASVASVLSTDATNKIATVAAVSGSFYTNGLGATAGISLFEHSLQAHTVNVGGVPYFIRENGCPIPEKRYNYALAEIIIEGVSSVTLPAAWDKYKCFRVHNLNAYAVTVDFAGVYTLTLQPFECKSLRRTTATTGYRLGFRYFQRYEDGDPRMFWFFPSDPSNSTVSTMSQSLKTAASGMQGNNLTNVAVIYDFIQWLADTDATVVAKRWASFVQDPHELADITAKMKQKFGDPGNTGTSLADLFWHKGKIVLAKSGFASGSPVVFDELQFRGVASMTADFAAKGIIVSTNGSGDLRIHTSDASQRVDFIPMGSNILKDVQRIINTPTFDDYTSFVQSGFTMSPNALSALVIGNPKIFEDRGNTNEQDVFGTRSFSLNNKTSYRIRQRSKTTVANTRSYVDKDGTTIVVTGPAIDTLAETAAVAPRTMTAVHTKTVADLLDLSWVGNPALGSQDDTYVSFVNRQMIFTPEGLVLKWTERLLASSPLPAITSGVYDYVNSYGRKYTLSNDGLYWELKHVLRFRGHGFGWGQHGRNFAAWMSPFWGRMCQCVGPVNDVFGASGADAAYPIQNEHEGNVKILRRISPTLDLGQNVPGQRFFLVGYGGNKNLDALVQFDDLFFKIKFGVYPNSIYSTTAAGLSFRNSVTSGNETTQRSMGGASIVLLTLLTEHYNALVQAVNQLKTGNYLSWKALRVPWGSRVMDFSQIPAWDYEDGAFGIPKPAPLNGFVRLDGSGATRNALNWKEFFTAQGVTIKTASDLPSSYATNLSTQNKKRTVRCTGNISVASLSWGSPRVVTETNLGPPTDFWWRTIIGTVTASADLTLSAESVFSTGSAYLATPRVEPDYELTPLATTLNPDSTGGMIGLSATYSGIQWVSLDDLKTLMESYHWPFSFGEVIYPLALDTWEAPATFDAAPYTSPYPTSVTYTGEVASRHTSTFGSSPAPANPGTPPTLAGITTKAVTANGLSYFTKLLAFRITKTSPQWKFPALGTNPYDQFVTNRTVFNRTADRTAGRERFNFGMTATVSVVGEEVNLGFVNINPAATRTAFPRTQWTETFNWVSSWVGGAWDARIGQPGDSDSAGVYIGALGKYVDLAAAVTEPLKTNMEHFVRYLHNEELFVAFQITCATSVTPDVPVYMVPQSQWGRVPDWWLTAAVWPHSHWVFVNTVNGSPATAPYRLVASAGAPNTVVCGAGLTLIDGGTGEACFRVFFPDPSALVLSL